MATTILSLIKTSGRIGGYSDDEEENIKDSILDVLRQIGISEEECENLLNEWHKYVEFDYVYYMLRNPGALNLSFHSIPRPEAITKYLSDRNFLTDEKKEFIKDYKYYIENRKHRRPDVWKKRKEWKYPKND